MPIDMQVGPDYAKITWYRCILLLSGILASQNLAGESTLIPKSIYNQLNKQIIMKMAT